MAVFRHELDPIGHPSLAESWIPDDYASTSAVAVKTSA